MTSSVTHTTGVTVLGYTVRNAPPETYNEPRVQQQDCPDYSQYYNDAWTEFWGKKGSRHSIPDGVGTSFTLSFRKRPKKVKLNRWWSLRPDPQPLACLSPSPQPLLSHPGVGPQHPFLQLHLAPSPSNSQAVGYFKPKLKTPLSWTAAISVCGLFPDVAWGHGGTARG